MALVSYHGGSSSHFGSVYRTESFGYSEHSYLMMEKRQVFLRSYQFCRKKSLTEKIKTSLVKAKKAVWFRLRSARKIRKLVWSRLRHGFYYRRRRFLRILNNNNYYYRYNNNSPCCW